MNERMRQIVLKWALKNAVDHSGKALPKAVMTKAIGEEPQLRRDIQRLKEAVDEAVREVNQLTLEEQRRRLRELAPELLERRRIEEKGLPPLPNAEKGRVVTRLPPEPSGYMHIGHAMSFTINYLYARMYDGKVWLRFEDTDPRRVHTKYYRNFRESLRWLGIDWDYEKNNSDSIPQYYEYAEQLLRGGHAYICTCPVEELRQRRRLGLECGHRGRDVETNLEEWGKLLEGVEDGQKRVLRLKGDMRAENRVMRDPVLLRIIRHRHPITGGRYIVWPTYDYAVALEDAICGITHVMRSSEFAPREELQDYIRSLLGFENPVYITYARFGFRGTILSKRRIRALIRKGLIPDWDDPRLPTIDGVRRRGILAETIREFTVKYAALTHSRKEYDWNLLFPINRRILDPRSRRYFFVPDPIPLMVRGAEPRTVVLNHHPQRDLGHREITVDGSFYVSRGDLEKAQEGQTIRLMGAYNVKIEKIGPDGAEASYHSDELLPETPKIQWVTERHVDAEVLVPDVLFVNGEFNENSLRVMEGLAEEKAKSIAVGEIVQLERIGFCRLDGKKDKLRFIRAHR